jgi:hypothetical protein
MPTIQLYKNGEKGPEHIAAEGAIDALEKVSNWIDAQDLLLPCADAQDLAPPDNVFS